MSLLQNTSGTALSPVVNLLRHMYHLSGFSPEPAGSHASQFYEVLVGWPPARFNELAARFGWTEELKVDLARARKAVDSLRGELRVPVTFKSNSLLCGECTHALRRGDILIYENETAEWELEQWNGAEIKIRAVTGSLGKLGAGVTANIGPDAKYPIYHTGRNRIDELLAVPYVPESDETWYCTFGHGHVDRDGKCLKDRYIAIRGAAQQVIERMNLLRGNRWAMRYRESEKADAIDQWNLKPATEEEVLL